MAQVMGYLRTTTELTGAALIVVHHQRKGGAGQGRAGDALRGHSSIEAAIDLGLHITREPGEMTLTAASTKTRGVDVPVIQATFEFEHRPGTNDLAFARFNKYTAVRGVNIIRDAIVRTLDELGPTTKGRLSDEVHERLDGSSGINKIKNWIGELIKDGTIKEKTGAHNAKVLSLK